MIIEHIVVGARSYGWRCLSSRRGQDVEMPCDDETRWRANINISPASHQEKENTVFTFRPFFVTVFYVFEKK